MAGASAIVLTFHCHSRMRLPCHQRTGCRLASGNIGPGLTSANRDAYERGFPWLFWAQPEVTVIELVPASGSAAL